MVGPESVDQNVVALLKQRLGLVVSFAGHQVLRVRSVVEGEEIVARWKCLLQDLEASDEQWTRIRAAANVHQISELTLGNGCVGVRVPQILCEERNGPLEVLPGFHKTALILEG